MDLSSHNCLVDTEWLECNLKIDSLRIVESTSLLPNYFEEDEADKTKKESGRSMWDKDHITGSIFIDILTELSDDKDGRFMYGMPSAEQFSSVMSQKGISNANGLVIYDRTTNMWAARLWWMLRAFGFENSVVLDGGYSKWVAEDRSTDNLIVKHPTTKFNAIPQPKLIAEREQVIQATTKDTTCIINALDPNEFEGKPPHRYGRGGRIPTSQNVPFTETVDLETQLYSNDDQSSKIFGDVGVETADEIICYCGGGIAACSTALLLTKLGHKKVSVYDGSMTEWCADPDLPLETGKI